jgi:hypothetical protein
MMVKYRYFTKYGKVVREPEYTFTPFEEFEEKVSKINIKDVIDNVTEVTIKGESERKLIEIEDKWFKIQTEIQKMDTERKRLEEEMNKPGLSEEDKKRIAAKIAELKDGEIIIEREFYNHYTRETQKVKEVIQTPYRKALEKRFEIENEYPYLKAYRGEKTDAVRPEPKIDPKLEKEIKKIAVRAKINLEVGDDKDLIADIAKALNAIMKKANGEPLTDKDKEAIEKYQKRQNIISNILDKDYK